MLGFIVEFNECVVGFCRYLKSNYEIVVIFRVVSCFSLMIEMEL
jgi:hypothetical protein